MLIIDGGSCCNLVSIYLVDKMKFLTTPHLRPYKLQWMTNSDEMKVQRQALVTISIGRYEDQVFCDVIPMSASHILLCQPWQFDIDA